MYITIPVDRGTEDADGETVSGVQYAVKDGGEYHTYGDQYWVVSGQAIADSHPDGTIVRRTVSVTYGEWEAVEKPEVTP